MNRIQITCAALSAAAALASSPVMAQRWHGARVGGFSRGMGYHGAPVAVRHGAFRPGIAYAGRGYYGRYPRYGYGYYRRGYPYGAAAAAALVGGLAVGAVGGYGADYYSGYPGYAYPTTGDAYYGSAYGRRCEWTRVQNQWGRFVSVPVCY